MDVFALLPMWARRDAILVCLLGIALAKLACRAIAAEGLGPVPFWTVIALGAWMGAEALAEILRLKDEGLLGKQFLAIVLVGAAVIAAI